jgi:hypothetical protein
MLMNRFSLSLSMLLVATSAWAGDHRTAGQIPISHTICLAELTPAGTDNFIGTIAVSGTLLKAWCIGTAGGAGVAPTIDISECAADGSGCVANTTAPISCTAATGGASTAAFAGAGGAQVDADDWMQATITNAATFVGIVTVCFRYQEN